LNKYLCGTIVLCLLAGLNRPQSLAQNGSAKPKESPAQVCFSKVKGLAGDWTHNKDNTANATIEMRYRLISGGTAIEEIQAPDSPGGMTSIYHLDNGSLVMTHYCSLGNQPHLKLTKGSTASKMEFTCGGGGGNMKSENEIHVHNLVITFVSADHIIQEWSAYKEGKELGPANKMDLYRKASK